MTINAKNTKEIQEKMQLCQKFEDVKTSWITEKILLLISEECIKYYNDYTKNFPISKKNIDKLINFFENEKNQKLWQNIFSKLYLLVGDTNKDFVNSFLKNKDWNNDSSKFIEKVLEELKNYPFVTDFQIDNISSEIKEKDLDSSKKFFKFQAEKSYWLIVQDKNKIISSEVIYSNIRYLRNSIFLCIKWNTWEFIKFNWENFEIIQSINDIKWVPEQIFSNWDLIYNTINGNKKTILFNSIWSDISGKEYDKIVNKFWLNFASKKNPESEKIDLDVIWDDFNKNFTHINWYEIKSIKDIIDLLKIQTQTWINYYEIINSKLEEIPYLKNIKRVSEWFFRALKLWKYAFVENIEKWCYLVTRTKDNIHLFFPMKWEMWESILIKNVNSTQYFWLDEKSFPCFTVDWKALYIFDRNNKKLYKYNGNFQFIRKNVKTEFKDLKENKSISEIKAENI